MGRDHENYRHKFRPQYRSEQPGRYAASQVLSDVLSSQRGDLYALVPQGKALFAGYSLNTLPKVGLGYAIAAFPPGTDGQSLVEEVQKILAEGLQKGFPPDLVEAAKRQEVTQAELQKNSVFGLAMARSQVVAVEGRQSPADDIKAIQAVTVGDVNRVARQYLDPNAAVIAILTPQTSGQPVASKPPGGVESFTPKHTESVELPDWAKQALERLSVPASTLNPVVTPHNSEGPGHRAECPPTSRSFMSSRRGQSLPRVKRNGTQGSAGGG